MFDAFISYSRHDDSAVKSLVAALEAAGFDCWRDTEDLPAGEVWRDELREAIVDSDNLLFVISPESIASPYCDLELKFALEHKKRIFPVLYRPLKQGQQLPAILAERQWLDVNWGSMDAERIGRAMRSEAKWRALGTDYLRRASNWDKKIGGLLPREELEAAGAWMEAGTRMDPGMDERQIRYIERSRAYHLEQAEHYKELHAKTLVRQLAAQAEVMVSQRGQLLEAAALLAVESMRRFPSFAGDRVLRKVLALLPRQVAEISWAKQPEDLRVRSAVLSPGGDYVAVLRETGDVSVWRCRTGDEVSRFRPEACHVLRFRPRSDQILSVGKEARVWSLKDGTELSRLDHERVSDAAFSADGGFLATVGGDSRTRIWDTDDYRAFADYQNAQPMQHAAIAPGARELVTWRQGLVEFFRTPGKGGQQWDCGAHGGVVFEYDPTGHYLSCVSPSDYTATLFDVRTKQELLFEERHWHAAFSGDGKYYALASPEWDASSYFLPSCWWAGHYWKSTGRGTLVREHKHGRVSCRQCESVHHDDSVNRVALSRTGCYLATTSRDGTARVWETRRGREVLRLVEGVVGHVRALVFSEDEHLVTGLVEGGCRTWETTGHRQVAALRHRDAVLDVAFSADGQYAATTSQDGTTRVWTIPEGLDVQLIETPRPMLSQGAVSLDLDGTKMLVDGRQIWEVATATCCGALTEDANQKIVAMSLDWRHALVAHPDHSVALILLAGGQSLGCLDSFDTDIVCGTLSMQSGRAAIAVRDQGVCIWAWEKGSKLTWLARDTDVAAVNFGMSGGKLAIVESGETGAVLVFDLSAPGNADQADRVQVFYHGSKVHSAILDPDERFLLTSTHDRSAEIWSLETKERICRFEHDADVKKAIFSPDGRYVLSAGGRSDRTARLWYWRPQDLLNEACSRISRDLTREEWERYFGDEAYRRTRELDEEVIRW